MKKYNTYLFALYGTIIDINIDESSANFWDKMTEFFKAQNANFTAEELESKYNRYVLDETGVLSSHLIQSTPGEERWPEIELDKVFYWLYSDKFDDSAPINNSLPNATEATVNALDWHQDFVNAVTVTPELLHSTMRYFRKESITHIKVNEGAIELLRELRAQGSKVILLTNAQRSFAEGELKELGLWQEFDDIFISSDYSCRKPDPHFYEAPLRKYKLDPAECLMIGSHPHDDIRGAKKAGMDAFYIHSALSPKSDNPLITAQENGADYSIPSSDLRVVKRMLIDQL